MSMLMPPVAFGILLLAFMGISRGFKWLAEKPANPAKDLNEPYACGEDLKSHAIQPDYSQFFPFAFFFTIMHVVALMVTTVPVITLQNLVVAVSYIACAAVGLLILYRR